MTATELFSPKYLVTILDVIVLCLIRRACNTYFILFSMYIQIINQFLIIRGLIFNAVIDFANTENLYLGYLKANSLEKLEVYPKIRLKNL